MMAFKIEHNFHTNRLEVAFSSALSARWLPLLNEHGQIVDLSLELRLLGGVSQVDVIAARLRAADQIFSEWDEQ